MLNRKVIVTSLALLVLASCSGKRFELASTPPDVNGLDDGKPPVEVYFGGGVDVAGKGNFSVPPAEAVVARIVNGLEKSVSPAAGNFARALTAVQKNLPQTTDPTKATGFDQIQLLVYGACSDLTTGTTPLYQSKYNVQRAQSVANNKAALVAAGMRILDQYTAGLASSSVGTAKIQTTLNSLVDKLAVDTSVTSQAAATQVTMAWMAVCIAANTSGSSLLGF